MFTDDVLDEGTVTASSSAARSGRRLSTGWMVMLVAGLVAAVANWSVLAGAGDRVGVAVLAEAAPAGTAVEALALDLRPVGADAALLGALVTETQLDSIAGGVIRTSVGAGEPLRRSDLGGADAVGLAAMSVPPSTGPARPGARSHPGTAWTSSATGRTGRRRTSSATCPSST